MAKSIAEREERRNVARIRSYADVRFGTPFRVGFSSLLPSRTKESFGPECDINVIMKRYEATGILPGMERVGGGRYMDCSGVDFQAAMTLVASARTMFAEMPSRIRERFRNDPVRLMEFLEDPKNLEEARELGLVKPEAKEATPLAVRVVESPRSDPEQTSKVSAGPGPTANAAPQGVKAKS